MADTQTKAGVELVATGTWAASTGVTTVTRAHLEAMLAAHNDGLVDRAPVKLGHVSGLNDHLGDGAPAYGWVVPTRIVDQPGGRSVLVGDLVGMPAMLAGLSDTAYRRRSAEIAWRVKTPGGKTYEAALVGLALLGVQAPAVKGLADVAAFYAAGEETAETVEHIAQNSDLTGNPVAVAMLAAAATAGGNPLELAAGIVDTPTVPQPNPGPAHDGTGEQHTAPAADRKAPPMPKTPEDLRKFLELEADGDVDAAIKAILDGQAPAVEPDVPAEQPAAVAPVAPEAPVTPATPAATATATAAPGTVSLSSAVYAELTALAEASRTSRRRDTVKAALRAGKIAPTEEAAYLAAIEANEETVTTLLAGLAPKFPTLEVGDDTAPDAQLSDGAAAAWAAWENGTVDVPRIG